jgi:N-acetylglucosaminyl-diphospho-decaprenol L-rhamnosyltransferase
VTIPRCTVRPWLRELATDDVDSTEIAGHVRNAALVIVNFGSHDLLRRNFGWAFGAEAAEFDGPVVVVDNHRSHADTSAMSRLAVEAGWDLVRCATNVGFGIGVNRGVERAWELGAEVVVVANPDLEITASQVGRLADAAADDRTALVSPAIVAPDGRPWGRLGGIDLRGGRLTTTYDGSGPGWLSGACLSAHRQIWQLLDGFDPDYFMYWEDVDLSVRCVRAGGRLKLLADVVVVHDAGGTAPTTVGKSPSYYYYNCRNRLVFASKLLGPRDAIRWVATGSSDVRRVISRGRPLPRRAKIRYALPPALRGCGAGVWWMLANAMPRRGIRR